MRTIWGGVVDAAIAADRELGPGLLDRSGLGDLGVLASWREAIWIRVRCYKSGKLFIVYGDLPIDKT